MNGLLMAAKVLGCRKFLITVFHIAWVLSVGFSFGLSPLDNNLLESRCGRETLITHRALLEDCCWNL